MHSVVKDLCKSKSDLTVEEVNHFLDELAQAEGKKEVEVILLESFSLVNLKP